MDESRRRFLVGVAGSAAGAGLIASRATDALAAAPLERVLDYSRSFVTFVTRNRGNQARLAVESRCVLLGDGNAIAAEFYQFASCKAEDTYAAENLFRDPNYDFSGVFARDQFVIFRVSSPQGDGYADRALVKDRFEDLRIEVRDAAAPKKLMDNKAAVAATLAGLPLVGRSTIASPDGKRRAMIEYPIKTMNVNDDKMIYQVDTGPIAFPDFAAERPAPANPIGPIDLIELAYVAYNRSDESYFILQRPTPVIVEGKEVCRAGHYSEIRTLPATNELFTVG